MLSMSNAMQKWGLQLAIVLIVSNAMQKREIQLAAMLAHMSSLQETPLRGASQEHTVLQLVELLNDVKLDQAESAEQLTRTMVSAA